MSKEDLKTEISDISSPVSVSSDDQELTAAVADAPSEFEPSHGTADSPMNVENANVIDEEVPYQPRGPRTPSDSPSDENSQPSAESPGGPPNLSPQEYSELSVENPRAPDTEEYAELSAENSVPPYNSPSTNDVNKPRKGPMTPPNSPPPDDVVPGPSKKGPRTPPYSPPHIQVDTSEEPVHFLSENSPYYGIDCSYYLSIPEHRPALEVALNRLQLVGRFTRKVRDLGDSSSYLPAVTTFRAPRLTYEEFISIVPNQTLEHFIIFNRDLERIDRAAENFRRLMMPPPSPRGDFGIQTSSSKKNSKVSYTKKCSKVQSASSTEQSAPQLTPETSGTKSVDEVVKEASPCSDEISVVYEGPTTGAKAEKQIEIVISDSSSSSPEGQNDDESEEDGKHTGASSVTDASNEAAPDEDKDDGYMSSSQHENSNRARNRFFAKEDLKRRCMSKSTDEEPKPKYTHTFTRGIFARLSSSASTDEDAKNGNIPKPTDTRSPNRSVVDQDKDLLTEKPALERQPENNTNVEPEGKIYLKDVRSSENLPRFQIEEPTEIDPLLTDAAYASSLARGSESSTSTAKLNYTVRLKQFENFTDDEDSKSPRDNAEKSPESGEISSKNSESESGTVETDDGSSRPAESEDTVVESEQSSSQENSQEGKADEKSTAAESKDEDTAVDSEQSSSQVYSQESKADDEKSTAAKSKDRESISFQGLGSVSPLKHRNLEEEQKDTEDPENVSPRKKSRKSDDDVTG